MDNWKMILATLEEVVWKEKGRTNRMKYEKIIMIKKHWNNSIYAAYQGNFLKKIQKKTMEPTKENRNVEEKLSYWWSY